MTSIEAAVAAVEARVTNLEGWQKSQNGHLRSLDKKVDSIKNWIMGLLGTAIVSLALLIVNLLKG
ncbi:MAG: hypothetical protein HPY52_11010 [Firmicutes bacterium]|nr:hypothetical protein [Bacillota bacterium]